MKKDLSLQLYPLVKLAFSLIMGMQIETWLNISFGGWIGLMVVSLVISCLVRNAKFLKSIGLLFSVGSLGGCLMGQAINKTNINLPSQPILYDAIVLTEPVEHGRVMKMDLGILKDDVMFKAKASLLKDTVAARYKRLHVGDGMRIYSQLEHPVNFIDSDFDYPWWLKTHGYVGETFIYYKNWNKVSLDLRKLSYWNRALLVAKKVRKRLLDQYHYAQIEGDNLAVLSAMTVGDKTLLSRELKDDYSVSGASHVLALSGLHLSIIYGILFYILSLCKGVVGMRFLRKFGIKEIIIMVAIWAYVGIVDFSPSVVRSALMLTIYSMVALLNRNKLSVNTLALAAIIMLIIQPLNLFDVGFQLSFMAVLSITLSSSLFYHLISAEFLQRFWMLKWIWGMLAVSIAAQLGTAPLVAYYFGRFSCYFLITNMVVVPCVMFILYLAVVMFATVSLPQIHQVITELVVMLTNLTNMFLHWVSSLPGASIDNIQISGLQVFLIYVFLFCCWLLSIFFHERLKFH